MSIVQFPAPIIDEFVELLASRPALEELIAYHPSKPVQDRLRELVAGERANRLSDEEQLELDQIMEAEMWIQLVKAKAKLMASTKRAK
ncbi:MAG TPA: hypothetical protein VGZ25_03810 [Gemmataceae bacterium]|jgi:hypothetical protein|nr:hypothetical protein [Gemmataceae bacterium]